ncbi:hypothetical protein RSOLAG1IB_09483 [Rhizoctonia solani AG-1 IB]|uniref:Uncharacterized protein n=1 Tax=Thanatephorus cucumeris (strain AG1-IB / isolate 7/3/14) TaxID=1108050 RepID=A0A0B7FTP8_THACB|nr:hypothetical protein RSOLAG1IB_09483 [Rhizoctonia solani AG-1 IB]
MIVRIAPCLWRTNDVLSCVREVGCAPNHCISSYGPNRPSDWLAVTINVTTASFGQVCPPLWPLCSFPPIR